MIPGLIFVQKAVLLGKFSGELIFDAVYKATVNIYFFLLLKLTLLTNV